MKIFRLLANKTSPSFDEVKFLKQRHDAYLLHQKSSIFKNPIPQQKVSFIKDMLVLIGVLPIIRPEKIHQRTLQKK